MGNLYHLPLTQGSSIIEEYKNGRLYEPHTPSPNIEEFKYIPVAEDNIFPGYHRLPNKKSSAKYSFPLLVMSIQDIGYHLELDSINEMKPRT